MISKKTFEKEVSAVAARIDMYQQSPGGKRNVTSMKREYAVFMQLMLVEIENTSPRDWQSDPTYVQLGKLRSRLSALINESVMDR